jgi:molybdopterin converting factor small subunit
LKSERVPARIAESNESARQNANTEVVFLPPVAPPGATMAISFQSDEEVLRKLRDKLRKMSDEELIRFGKEVRRLAENQFQRQLGEARAEWKRRKLQSKAMND